MNIAWGYIAAKHLIGGFTPQAGIFKPNHYEISESEFIKSLLFKTNEITLLHLQARYFSLVQSYFLFYDSLIVQFSSLNLTILEI